LLTQILYTNYTNRFITRMETTNNIKAILPLFDSRKTSIFLYQLTYLGKAGSAMIFWASSERPNTN